MIRGWLVDVMSNMSRWFYLSFHVGDLSDRLAFRLDV